jgi:hypothetical protein
MSLVGIGCGLTLFMDLNVGAGLQKMWLVGVLQSQTEDFALFNVQERGKYG